MTRNRILTTLLWLSVIGLSTWVGGTLYQMLVIVPIWSASPPESVRSFFLGTDYNRTIFHFFGPPIMAARTLPVAAALIAAWPFSRHRKLLLVTAACLVFAVIFTWIYIYPINAVLFDRAGGNQSGEEIRVMAQRWIWADRLRFVVGVVGFLALLRAFRLPMPKP